jgi:hypothetical protein
MTDVVYFKQLLPERAFSKQKKGDHDADPMPTMSQAICYWEGTGD